MWFLAFNMWHQRETDTLSVSTTTLNWGTNGRTCSQRIPSRNAHLLLPHLLVAFTQRGAKTKFHLTQTVWGSSLFRHCLLCKQGDTAWYLKSVCVCVCVCVCVHVCVCVSCWFFSASRETCLSLSLSLSLYNPTGAGFFRRPDGAVAICLVSDWV